MATINGQRLISCEIRMPRLGIWTADFEADVSAEGATDAFAPDDEGRVRVEIEHAGATFKGTATRIGTQGARLSGRAVGGRDGLSKVIGSKNYEAALGVKASLILGDILREAGETLSSTVAESVLEMRVPRWTRVAGPARTAVAKLAEKLGLSWRVLRDGTVWIGRDDYPTVTPPHVLVGTDDHQSGTQVLAARDEDETGPLTLDPGVTLNGRKLEQVVHRISNGTLRTEANETTPAAAFSAAMGGQSRELAYSRRYSAKISQQHADGTVQVVPDDASVAGSGLDKVRIWLGVPGSVRVPNGTRCVLEFKGGDPSEPFVSAFGSGSVTELKLGAGTQALALASLVSQQLTALKNAISSAPTAPNDGGAAFKAGILNALSSWPGSVASTKLFGE